MVSVGSHKLVHLDLKGCPPHVTYLEELFPLLRDAGATGLLIEWEDTFPYTRELSLLGSKGPSPGSGAYTTEEARLILQLASDAGLIVVPLVQTFGHFEYVLKHDKWKHLREVSVYPSSMCPSQSGALPLIALMIKQIVDFHPDIQFLHIGCDEVWHMGLCSTCSQRIKVTNGRLRLFLDHVTAVAQFVNDTYPHLSVIMWDDMLRPIDVHTLLEYNLGKLIEPMVWDYHTLETFNLPADLWDKYASVFANVWAATAFKGATGGRQLTPVIEHHVSNHVQWLRVLERNAGKFKKFRGITLTGWSRYDHYAALCEMFPPSLPSLLVCLKTWVTGGYSNDLYWSIAKALGFTSEAPLPLNPLPRPQAVPHKLNFPGWKLYVGIESFANLKHNIRSILESDRVETWLNSYQIEHHFGNPMQLDSLLPTFKEYLVSRLLFELNAIENYIFQGTINVIYPEGTEEWIGTNIMPLKVKLVQIIKDTEVQLSIGARVKDFSKPA